MEQSIMDDHIKMHERNARKQRQLLALSQLTNASSGGNEAVKSDEQLRDEMYEDMWNEYVALK